MSKRTKSWAAIILTIGLVVSVWSLTSYGIINAHGNVQQELSKQSSDQTVLTELTARLDGDDLMPAFEYLTANIEKLTTEDATAALEAYTKKLQQRIPIFDATLENLQQKYWPDSNQDILTRYNLTMDDLNNLDRLQEDSSLADVPDLKGLLITARQLGLQLQTAEGTYYFVVDYGNLLSALESGITDELTSWLKILASYYNDPAMKDAALIISFDELAKRIVAMEEFQVSFPDSHHSSRLNQMYENYLSVYLYGANNTPAYDYETKVLKPEAQASFEKTVSTYQGYPLYNLVNDYLVELKATSNKLTPELQKAMTTRIKDLVGGIYVDTKTITSKTDMIEVDVWLPILPESNALMAKINTEIEQQYLQAQAEVEVAAQAAQEAGWLTHPYSTYSSYHIPYNQSGILSIVYESYQYTGGAHGMPYKTVYNVDTTDERLLTLKDFFPERPDHLTYIKEEIKKAIQAEPEGYFEDAVETVDTWEEEPSFYVQEENIVVFFHPYDIAPYAAGFREFEIPWDVLP